MVVVHIQKVSHVKIAKNVILTGDTMSLKVSYQMFGTEEVSTLYDLTLRALKPPPYSVEGKVEIAQAQAQLNSEFLALLVDKLVELEVFDEDDISELFSYKVDGGVEFVED